MQLEDYFEFEKFDSPFGPFERIRIKGHRIAIEHVLHFYKEGLSPEEILKVHYPSLTLEKIYATITYYLHDTKKVDDYLQRSEEVANQFYEEWSRNHKPSPLELKLRQLRAGASPTQQESA